MYKVEFNNFGSKRTRIFVIFITQISKKKFKYYKKFLAFIY